MKELSQDELNKVFKEVYDKLRKAGLSHEDATYIVERAQRYLPKRD